VRRCILLVFLDLGWSCLTLGLLVPLGSTQVVKGYEANGGAYSFLVSSGQRQTGP
jgi:hypothetical protein